ncbi:DNA-binding SARP family transcriptional activator [Kribbella orskensis]|uniref:DNA-binding SARP family transcriptional activator n=1 Tax=Kribbella orskensis TaxID=2512216 RepID=A0ABY2BWK9_9ACTN|nr:MULTISPECIES: BTAD domain-containing putative transcriptional regulator [Kribbella]TCN44308.1 DNA-binding SARP family transcriptional activator [Kribbella sp. VKM Ac-2500]TCO31914.1 DNA-binding SARP family transcriptional activator [Kribbella orskensis]
MQGAVDDSVRFDLLGPLRAFRGQRELDLGPAKQRAVLAILLLAANRPVPTSRIIEAVWGDEPPENGTNVVQKYVAGLRRVLEPERAPRAAGLLLTLTEAGYRLSVAPGNTDLDLFTSHVREARQLRGAGRRAEAAAELQTALSLWRAEPLAGLTGSYFDATRARLADDRAAAVEDWAELELEQGHQQNLLPELSRLVAEFPLRERLRGVQMLALYRAGRQAEALATYREARTLLVTAHGVEPGNALQHLHQQILQNDPTLTTPQSSPAPTSAAGAAPAVFGWAAPPPPQPVPQYSPPEALVQAGEPESLRWQDWVVKFAAAAVPIISVGMLSGPLVGVLAIRRRSVRLGAAAVGYLAVTFGGALLMDTSSDEITSDSDELGVALVIASALVCAIHVAVIVPRRRRTPGLDPRRQYARQLAAEHPQIARQLGIGRPDLPNQFEDGGLIDINDAPEAVLRTLPGVSAEQAALIVADRTHRGPFRSLEDLSGRGLFPSPIPPQVAEVLLIIRVQDTVDDDRR